jgi:hypothetical protein
MHQDAVTITRRVQLSHTVRTLRVLCDGERAEYTKAAEAILNRLSNCHKESKMGQTIAVRSQPGILSTKSSSLRYDHSHTAASKR